MILITAKAHYILIDSFEKNGYQVLYAPDITYQDLLQKINKATGLIALDATTGELINTDIAAETAQVMKNIIALLTAANTTTANIVKTTIFLSDMSLFAAVNEVYGSYFDKDAPARETVAVKGLPKNVNVEISVTAFL